VRSAFSASGLTHQGQRANTAKATKRSLMDYFEPCYELILH
jgi:hypothetical protein